MLSKRLSREAESAGVHIRVLASPAFLNDPADNREWRSGRKRWTMKEFYAWQRQRLDILMDGTEPAGGKYSFDEENRRKLPKKEKALLPVLPVVEQDATIKAAIASIESDFPDNPGSLDQWYYPTDRSSALQWLDQFLAERFVKFGVYEDAMVSGQSWLYHGVATYDELGVAMRTTNHWQHHRAMPDALYDGTTGIKPVDETIERILETGYCHHIERLMVLGGFMFLCEIDPDAIYVWFMEMFIDSYDWVMVPNVYAMSQHADGGAITTKPYFSGSNYVLKMSDYAKGEWCVSWDALFWRWVIKNSEALAGNPRWSMMVANARRMPDEKKQAHITEAERFLSELFGT